MFYCTVLKIQLYCLLVKRQQLFGVGLRMDVTFQKTEDRIIDQAWLFFLLFVLSWLVISDPVISI